MLCFRYRTICHSFSVNLLHDKLRGLKDEALGINEIVKNVNIDKSVEWFCWITVVMLIVMQYHSFLSKQLWSGPSLQSCLYFQDFQDSLLLDGCFKFHVYSNDFSAVLIDIRC